MTVKEGGDVKRVARWGTSVENFVLVSTFIVMTLGVVIQVLNRNLLHLSMPWLEEIALYSMIYLVMFGVEAGLRDGSQIRVTALRDVLPKITQRAFELTVKIIIAVFSYTMVFYSGTAIWTQLETGQVSPVLHLAMWVPYASFPVVFFVIAIVHTIGAIKIVRGEESPLDETTGVEAGEKGMPS